MLRKGARSTALLLDQYIPEMWEKVPHSYLGTVGSFRYRLQGNYESKVAMYRIKANEPIVAPNPYEVLVESHFRTLNACLIANNMLEVRNAVTDEFQRTLKDTANTSNSQQRLPLARMVRVSQPPVLVQSRIFALDVGKEDGIGQLTFRMVTEQKLVDPITDSLEVFPLPFSERRCWFPYVSGTYLGKAHYFQPSTGEKLPTLEPRIRFTTLPVYHRAKRGTFGATGKILKQEGDFIEVENHIVMERILKYLPGSEWKIHHF